MNNDKRNNKINSPNNRDFIPNVHTHTPIVSNHLNPHYPHNSYNPRAPHLYQRRRFSMPRSKYPHKRRKKYCCSNCNGVGHLFKDCRNPIQSNGIIGVKVIKNDESGAQEGKNIIGDEISLKYLLIERKNSIGYEAFIRAKFKPDELQTHLERMTNDEKERIKRKCENNENGMIAMYDEIAIQRNSKYVHKERKRAKDLYGTLDINDLFENTKSQFESPGWEFPKGRRYTHENDLECAIREFEEETNLSPYQYTLLNWDYYESFIGTNKKPYRNRYYVGIIHEGVPDLHLDFENLNQITEIRDIGWFSIEEAIEKIRPYRKEKIKVLMKTDIGLKKYLPILYDISIRKNEDFGPTNGNRKKK